MNIEQKIEWNEESSLKYGWEPSWFGCDEFNSRLIKAIQVFQFDNGLKADGLCGSSTYRKIWTQRTLDDDDQPSKEYSGHIIYKGQNYPIKWDKVVTYKAQNGLKCKAGTYSDYENETRKSTMFVTHWDVTLSSAKCARILNERGISVHFCIDNDGTIYQLVDMNDAAWHAGDRRINHSSVGVEISNAYDLRWQDWYVSKGFGERPIMSGVFCHGRKLEAFLGFYPIQLKALAALYAAISQILDIPLQAPTVANTVDPKVKANDFKGFCSHYHITTRKIDCAGLDIQSICDQAITLNQD